MTLIDVHALYLSWQPDENNVCGCSPNSLRFLVPALHFVICQSHQNVVISTGFNISVYKHMDCVCVFEKI